MEINSGHERPFARLGQAELARIFPSQLQISPGSRLRIGFDNVDVGSKYQFLVSAEHEAILSIGVDAEIGGTGPFAAFATRNCSTVFA